MPHPLRNSGRSPLHVVHILPGLGYGGMERLVFEMISRSDKSRFRYSVLNLVALGRFAHGLDAHARVLVAKPMGKGSLLRPVSLARDIATLDADVVHSHSGVWYKASLAARMARVPWLVHTEHGRALSEPWLARAMDGAASRRTDVVVAVSGAVGGILTAGISKRPDRVRVVPNGVDTDAYRPRPDTGSLRAELAIPAESPIIGSIGRLEPIKGYDVLLEAFALLVQSWRGGAPPVLVVAGDGSERARLEKLTASRGIAHCVHLIGWRNDIRELHSAFTLFAMTSHSEGMSVSLLEAMSAGLCPVVTDVGGNAAALGPMLKHRLVPPREAGQFAAALADALRSPARLGADRQLARERVVECFTLDAMVRAYEDIYEEGFSNLSRVGHPPVRLEHQ